jgi:hypothetical protein
MGSKDGGILADRTKLGKELMYHAAGEQTAIALEFSQAHRMPILDLDADKRTGGCFKPAVGDNTDWVRPIFIWIVGQKGCANCGRKSLATQFWKSLLYLLEGRAAPKSFGSSPSA